MEKFDWRELGVPATVMIERAGGHRPEFDELRSELDRLNAELVACIRTEVPCTTRESCHRKIFRTVEIERLLKTRYDWPRRPAPADSESDAETSDDEETM